jgi:hypothetical protein
MAGWRVAIVFNLFKGDVVFLDAPVERGILHRRFSTYYENYALNSARRSTGKGVEIEHVWVDYGVSTDYQGKHFSGTSLLTQRLVTLVACPCQSKS